MDSAKGVDHNADYLFKGAADGYFGKPVFTSGDSGEDCSWKMLTDLTDARYWKIRGFLTRADHARIQFKAHPGVAH
ncbi:MAG TPA: hypothetical protein VHK70_10215 [Burkholderiaceae bacterium]|jgi:hypothetical protein|nr:hypothetical protein [Burkholderiaceae bacterium]